MAFENSYNFENQTCEILITNKAIASDKHSEESVSEYSLNYLVERMSSPRPRGRSHTMTRTATAQTYQYQPYEPLKKQSSYERNFEATKKLDENKS